MYEDLKEMWRGKRSPYNKFICRKCVPGAFPAESLQEYPIDSYHVGSRFRVFQLFAVTFTIYIDGVQTVCCDEARADEDGWLIEEIVLRRGSQSHFETVLCPCSYGNNKVSNPAERLRFGRVTMVPKLEIVSSTS